MEFVEFLMNMRVEFDEFISEFFKYMFVDFNELFMDMFVELNFLMNMKSWVSALSTRRVPWQVQLQKLKLPW